MAIGVSGRPVTRRVASAAAVLAMAMASLGVAAAPSALAAPPPDSVPTTTTTAPTTTTTMLAPTTTTTVAPTTTSTTAPTTTSTVAPTTTTSTTAPLIASNSSSGAPWTLIVILVILVALIVLLAVLLRRRLANQKATAWHQSAAPALDDARLARESLLSASAVSSDPNLRGAVEAQVDRASRALEQAAATAPDQDDQRATSAVASSLRGLAFAVEADRLLRHGAGAPSGVQLAQADDARRARLAEFDTAVARLSARVSMARSGRR
jgi:hypothetical protein